MRSLLLFLLLAGFACTQRPPVLHKVTFLVSLGDSARTDHVFVTGNVAKLGSWNPAAVPLTMQSESLFSATVLLPEDERVIYKVTGGSWWTEALDTSERLYGNLEFNVQSDTSVHVYVFAWRNRLVGNIPLFSATRFREQRPDINLDALWRFHPGDNPEWSSPAYADSNWVIADPFIQWEEPGDPTWDGIGWFRFHMFVDSSLWNRSVAIRIKQMGASEIYYNGRLLYRFGKVGTPSTTVPNAMSWWRDLRLDPRHDQLIAVRYANYDSQGMTRLGYAPGFLITLAQANVAFRMAADVRENASRQTAFFVIPLILFFLHISLYGFHRKNRENLFYAICMLGFAGLTYFNYEKNVVTDVDQVLLFTKLNAFSVALTILFGLLTIFDTMSTRLPKRIWMYSAIFAFLAGSALLGFGGKVFGILNYCFFGLTMIEGFLMRFRQPKRKLPGGNILRIGFLIVSAFIILQVLVDFSFMENPLGSTQPYAVGMIGLAVAMSVFLSSNFARVNRDLEAQIDQVKRLSEERLEQERLAHTMDVERKLLEAESERKSAELESARQLQLSLLPKALPEVEGLEIAAFMKTAAEVGGDYYDFFLSDEGVLTVTVGDATGHGLKAGNLVTATKGLLQVLSGTDGIEEILASANTAIKRMDLRMLTMCLSVARFAGNVLQYASAGMPPALVYRAARGVCEDIVIKAMPLGAVAGFPYPSKEVSLNDGDIVLLATDGLQEFFNTQHETYGIEAVRESLQRHAGKPAREVTQALFADACAWGGGAALEDDLTIVVVKKEG